MEPNRARFYNIIYNTTFDEHERYNIGTYKEKKLHIILKKYFEEDTAYHEIRVNGFIADVCRDGVITEIETSGFSGLCPKLEAYLPEYRVNLVYPLAAVKYVSWIDPETSEISPRKKSPKKANVYDAIFELVRILPHVNSTNLTVAAPMLEIDEYRMLDGWSRDRKRGSNRYERVPVDLLDIVTLTTDDDYRAQIPESLPEQFTAKEFCKAIRRDERIGRGVMKVLETRGVLTKTEKQGRSQLWMRS
ncbi:MAG: hypothetical protein IJX93_00720 [Clostridia bacterium]|nr:hypothetical protein [Clostridia bacterium]